MRLLFNTFRICQLVFICCIINWPFNQAIAQAYFQQQVNYVIDVKLNDKLQELSAFEAIEYINNSPDTLRFIFFHLWPNGYLNNNTVLAGQVISQKGKGKLFNDSELSGYIDSLDFKVNGRPVNWNLLKDQPDVCLLTLDEGLMPGDTIQIATPFHVKIPKGVTSRLGHIGESYQISQWYPKPAVYDINGWHPMSYQDQGEFYSEFGEFDVSITLPTNYVVGATGNLQNGAETEWLKRLASDTTWLSTSGSKTSEFPPSSQQLKTLRYTENNIHDFAWFADKRFHVLRGEVRLPDSGRVVTTWAFFTDFQADLWKEAIKYVNSSIGYFSTWNGDYPYRSFTAVQSALNAGTGMEYPEITVIGKVKDAYTLDDVIAHEIGHSWFYSALGSDERRYPYMDEGITSTNEVRYMDEKYPDKKLWELYFKKMRPARFFHVDKIPAKQKEELEWLAQARQNLEQPINLPSEDYTTLNYSLIVYNKAGISFSYLRAYLGDSIYDAAMHDYFLTWKFKHPQPENLRKIVEFHAGKALPWFFDDLLGTTKRIDYKIVRMTDGQLLVRNLGELASPLIVSGMKGDSICCEKWIDGFTGEKWIELPPGNFTAIKIDPGHFMPELSRLNNNIKTSGIFRKADPIQTQLYLTLENPEKRYIMYLPLVNWTRENGFMTGIALHNGFLLPKRFEYFIIPFYGFNNHSLAGSGKITWNITPFGDFIRKATVSLEGTQYGAPGNQNFQNVKAGIEVNFRSRNMTRYISQKIYGNYISASNLYEIELGQKANMSTYFLLGYKLQRSTIVNPFSVLANLESSQSYLKATAELNYKISYYGKQNGLDIRLFTGAMVKDNPAVPFYSLSASGRGGRELYLYQGTYPDRFSVFPTTFWSRQMDLSEGGLISPVNQNFGYSRWLISLSLFSSLPSKLSRIPVKPFSNFVLSDHGSMTAPGTSFFFEAGITTGLWNFFQVYIPLVVSGNIESMTGSYRARIRLIFQLEALKQTNLKTGIRF